MNDFKITLIRINQDNNLCARRVGRRLPFEFHLVIRFFQLVTLCVIDDHEGAALNSLENGRL